MSDGFTDFLDRTQAFCRELAQNNTKDWFEPRKAKWKADVEAPAKLLGEIMAEEISRMTGAPHTAKLFRIHRDVRFSKDKSPYKTHLALLWASADADDLAPSFYFGIEPDSTTFGCGTPGFDKEALIRYRAMVDAWGAPLSDIIEASGARIIRIGPPPLKRVPKPYDADHPQGGLLKRKSLALGVDLPAGWRDTGDGLVAALTDCTERLLPFRSFLAERL